MYKNYMVNGIILINKKYWLWYGLPCPIIRDAPSLMHHKTCNNECKCIEGALQSDTDRNENRTGACEILPQMVNIRSF